MKRFLALFLLVFVCPVFLQGGVLERAEYWLCSQPGRIDNSIILAISKVRDVDQDDEKKERHFEERVQEVTDFSFEADYSASCRGFVSVKKREEYLKSLLKKAFRYNFAILWIHFAKKTTN